MDTHFWHPFAQMSSVRGHELVIARGEDVWVFDTDDNRYLDATASLWYANVGHGRTEIADAAAAQMRQLEAYNAFGEYANPPALELCRRLAELAPMDDARVFLGSGGGDAIDTAAKLARRYWFETGSPERVHVISRTNGYHGTHGYGTGFAGIDANRVGWGPLDAASSRVAHDSAEALEVELQRVGPENVAAFFVEPVIGAGGVYPPTPGYIETVARLCKEAGVLLIVDSVICAFGRLGTWFGIERWPGVEPDLITFAKGVTSGYLPLGGVVVGPRVAAPFWDAPDAPVFRHGATYAGHASCCAAALANLDILEREQLIPRGQELEGDLHDALKAVADHALVGEVRGGMGLLGAVELAPDLLASNPGAPVQVAARCRDQGVIVRPLARGLAVSPPLTISTEHLGLITEALATALDQLVAAAASA